MLLVVGQLDLPEADLRHCLDIIASHLAYIVWTYNFRVVHVGSVLLDLYDSHFLVLSVDVGSQSGMGLPRSQELRQVHRCLLLRIHDLLQIYLLNLELRGGRERLLGLVFRQLVLEPYHKSESIGLRFALFERVCFLCWILELERFRDFVDPACLKLAIAGR